MVIGNQRTEIDCDCAHCVQVPFVEDGRFEKWVGIEFACLYKSRKEYLRILKIVRFALLIFRDWSWKFEKISQYVSYERS